MTILCAGVVIHHRVSLYSEPTYSSCLGCMIFLLASKYRQPLAKWVPSHFSPYRICSGCMTERLSVETCSVDNLVESNPITFYLHQLSYRACLPAGREYVLPMETIGYSIVQKKPFSANVIKCIDATGIYASWGYDARRKRWCIYRL